MNLNFSAIKESKNLLAFSAGVDSSALFFLLLKQNIPFDIAIVNYNVRVQSKDEVNYAKELIKQSEKDPYDNVFCVIDRDRHTSFDTAIVQINSFRNKHTKLHSIISNPCFEYWILLHFIYTTKLFGASGDSPCMDLIKNDLKIYLPDYEKGDKAIMPPIIKAGLEMAVANAKRANEVAEKNATDTPTTQMDKLVAYLRNLKVSM